MDKFDRLMQVASNLYDKPKRKTKRQRQGRDFEQQIKTNLEKLGFKVLTNLYIPNGAYTSEIDLIAIGMRGVYVIEAKNYKARIVGSKYSTKWYAYYKNYGYDRYSFYSPLLQNKTHLAVINALLGYDIPLYQLVVFPTQSTLEVITENPYDVIKLDKLEYVLSLATIKLTETKVKEIVEALEGYENPTDSTITTHKWRLARYNKFNYRQMK